MRILLAVMREHAKPRWKNCLQFNVREGAPVAFDFKISTEKISKGYFVEGLNSFSVSQFNDIVLAKEKRQLTQR